MVLIQHSIRVHLVENWSDGSLLQPSAIRESVSFREHECCSKAFAAVAWNSGPDDMGLVSPRLGNHECRRMSTAAIGSRFRASMCLRFEGLSNTGRFELLRVGLTSHSLAGLHVGLVHIKIWSTWLFFNSISFGVDVSEHDKLHDIPGISSTCLVGEVIGIGPFDSCQLSPPPSRSRSVPADSCRTRVF